MYLCRLGRAKRNPTNSLIRIEIDILIHSPGIRQTRLHYATEIVPWDMGAEWLRQSYTLASGDFLDLIISECHVTPGAV